MARDGGVHVDQAQEVQAQGWGQSAEQPTHRVNTGLWPGSARHNNNTECRVQHYSITGAVDVHAAKLQAVGIGLMMRGQVVVVEDSDAEHGGVDAVAQVKYGEEARHLVDKSSQGIRQGALAVTHIHWYSIIQITTSRFNSHFMACSESYKPVLQGYPRMLRINH